MVGYVFWGPFLIQTSEVLLERTITLHRVPEIQTQSLVIRSTSKVIHLPCVFVIRRGRYGQLCSLCGNFWLQMAETPKEIAVTVHKLPEN